MPFFPCRHKVLHEDQLPQQKTIQGALNTVQSIRAALQSNSLPSQQTEAPRSSNRTHPIASPVLITVGLAALAGALLYAARSPRIPKGIAPVEGFNLDRYLGKWYEIARIEHVFEKGLQRTQAEYSTRTDGAIQVINRGFDPKRNEWKIVYGQAEPTIAPDIAALKVSFFRPFYAGYNVVALDKDYQWAMVVGDKLDYFWILSRTPSLPDAVEKQLVRQAQLLGIDTQKIVWIHQDGVNPTGSYI